MNKNLMVTPLKAEEIKNLTIGDIIYISGTIFTLRDMGHLKIRSLLEEGKALPKNFEGTAIFHAGPVTHKDDKGNWILNVIGPTTSIRMEPYASMIGELGVRAVIGKGGMGEDTIEACKKYGYIYLQAAPGCAAVLAKGIEKVNDVTWLEFGMPEALWDLCAIEFGPLIVGMDAHGNSIYKDLQEEAIRRLNLLYV